MRYRFFIAFFLLFFSLIHAADLSICIQNINGSDLKIPIVISGKQFMDAGNPASVERTAIRVFGKSGAEYPCQVDCRTQSGTYGFRKDEKLSPWDEIVFLANVKKDQEYRITTAGKRTEVKDLPFTVKRPTDLYWDLSVSNRQGITVLIKTSGAKTKDEVKLLQSEEKEWTVAETGANALPLEMLIESKPKVKKDKPKKVFRGDFAKGGMNIIWDKINMTSGISWTMGTSPAQPFGRGIQDAPWSSPVTIANGPVRRIIRMTYVESDGKDIVSNGMYTRKGLFGKLAVENLFTIYADGGIVDYEERVLYEKLDQYALLEYTLAITSGASDINQDLILPDDVQNGAVYVMPMSKLAEYYKDEDPKSTAAILFFNNPVQHKTLDGYLGIRNLETKRGIAVFYETPQTFTREFSSSMRLRVRALNNKQSNTLIPVITQEFFEGKNKFNGTLGVKFRYFLFEKQPEQCILPAYRVWSKPEKYIFIKSVLNGSDLKLIRTENKDENKTPVRTIPDVGKTVRQFPLSSRKIFYFDAVEAVKAGRNTFCFRKPAEKVFHVT